MVEFDVKLDTTDVMSKLENWLGRAAGEMTRPIAQAGAQVFADEIRRRAQSIPRKTGLLGSSIYQAFSVDDSYNYGSTYHVSWRVAGGRKSGKKRVKTAGLPSAPHGHLLEYGHWRHFKVHRGTDGHWWTIVRPEWRGKLPEDKSIARMPLAEKSKFFYPLSSPKWVPPSPFLHPGYEAAKGNAIRVMLERAAYEFNRLGSP